MQKLTGAMIRALFDHEAVFIGLEDVVPDWRIAELFGADALAFAQRFQRLRYWRLHGALRKYPWFPDSRHLSQHPDHTAGTPCSIRHVKKSPPPRPLLGRDGFLDITPLFSSVAAVDRA